MSSLVIQKILCLHQSAELYGSDRSFLSVVQHLSKLPDVSIKVVLPCNGPLVNRLITIGITPIIVPGGVIRKKELKKNPIYFIISTFRAVLKLRKLMVEADIIYVNTIVYLAAYLAGASLLSRKHRWAHIREIPSPYISRIVLLFFILGRFRRIYNSFQTRIAFGDRSAFVVYNGVSDPLVVNLPIRETGLKVLILGRISGMKGHELAIRALEMHLEDLEGVELIIVGDAYQNYEDLVDELKSLVVRCRLQVSFYPFAADPSCHFIDCDLVLIPSTSPESFGRVAIEAFSYGRPVIAAKHGGLTEIVTHNETGYLFEPNKRESLAENVQKYIDKDIKERQLISLEARKRYEMYFDEKKYTSKIKDILLNERS